MITAVESFPVSTRRELRPGMLFRVRRGSGPYLVTTGVPVGVEPGEYRAIRVWRDTRRRSRLYCDAVHSGSGRTHTLYISGPTYRSGDLHTLCVRPYAIKLLAETREDGPRTRGKGGAAC